jgi:hypothetical protein
VLPNFIIVGAPKCATTSLYEYLRQHPQVFMSPFKEPRFFACEGTPLPLRGPGDERLRRRTTVTLPEYERLFQGSEGAIARGEASTMYLGEPGCAARIARRIPEARLIAVLRNPADRAFSAWGHKVREGHETRSLEDALLDEPLRIQDGWHATWHYRSRGEYARQLEPYLALFPKSRIKVVLYDDFQSPARLLADLFQFLGVDPAFRPNTSARHNPSGRARVQWLQRALDRRGPVKDGLARILRRTFGHPAVERALSLNLQPLKFAPETRARLLEEFRGDIQHLETLIERNLSHWFKHAPMSAP